MTYHMIQMMKNLGVWDSLRILCGLSDVVKFKKLCICLFIAEVSTSEGEESGGEDSKSAVENVVTKKPRNDLEAGEKQGHQPVFGKWWLNRAVIITDEINLWKCGDKLPLMNAREMSWTKWRLFSNLPSFYWRKSET